MNKIYRLAVPALMAATALGMVSCEDDLDTAPLSSTVTADQKADAKEQNPEMVLAGVTGIASIMNSFQTVLEKHSDFGYPALMLFSDCRGQDMVTTAIGYNWFAGASGYTDCNTTSDHNKLTWGLLYKQVHACNAVIADVDSATTDPTQMFYRAQALAFRAFDYMMLAQNYQFPYAGHEDLPCIMLLTEKNEAEAAANGMLPATVGETYAKILDDLMEAIGLLEESGVTPEAVLADGPKRLVSVAAAYGLLARAALLTEQWELAADAAEMALAYAGRDGLRPLSLQEAAVPGFIDINSPSWLWGIPVAETDRTVTSGIINFPSHMGSLNYGYASVGAWRRISKKLFDTIPATDVRRGWWLDADGVSTGLPANMQTYATGRGVPPYAVVKFAPYGNQPGSSNNASDIPLMRVEEMYLILAEATAMADGDGAGLAVLSSFVKQYRDPSFAPSAAPAREQVFDQRRVELWGEGLTYYDFLRMGKGIDRRGAGFPAAYVFNIPAGDNLLRLPIPEVESNGNELFRTQGVNNPSAPAPVAVQE